MNTFLNGIPLFEKLDEPTQELLIAEFERYRFTFQQRKQLIDFAVDFQMWGEKGIGEYFKESHASAKTVFKSVEAAWVGLKKSNKSYQGFSGSVEEDKQGLSRTIVSESKHSLGFGHCPVASEKTRCCNLLTLDAVEGCSFDCSYCSIRTFYKGNDIAVDSGFVEKLRRIQIDPDVVYHIGTGQSSDSLLWGNRNGILEGLFEFAAKYPNVILELKTKSDNVEYVLNHPVPKNILFTWSLNTVVIIENEEHFTASLDRRLNAARKVADKGSLVGFHFHPIVPYQGSSADYEAMYRRVHSEFIPAEVAMVSFGTLTFIKPVIKNIRKRKIQSKILQMPLSETSGKFSYPLDVKREIFNHAYKTFESWHDSVFFYLCMEDASLWMDVFGFEYPDNLAMEEAMKTSYLRKIDEKRDTHR